MWSSNPSLLIEKLRVLSSLPIAGHIIRGGISGGIVSQPLLAASMWFSSNLPCVIITQSVTRSF